MSKYTHFTKLKHHIFLNGGSSRFPRCSFQAMAQFGVMPVELWWPWLLGGAWRLEVMLLMLVVLRRAEPEASGKDILPSMKNKPGEAPNRPVLARSGRGGCGWRWGTGRSGVPEVNHEASVSGVLLSSAKEATLRLGAVSSDRSSSSRPECQSGGSSSTSTRLHMSASPQVALSPVVCSAVAVLRFCH
jgi:hypothetical protein